MDRMVKPAEYAKELGISRQAVYAKIKRGVLNSKNIDGKLYIVVDNNTQANINIKHNLTKSTTQPKTTNTQTPLKDYESLLCAKDETISILKGTVKDLKKSNKQISTTLRGEIDLLKEAFHEMRSLYAMQLEYQKPQEEAIEVYESEEEKPKAEWISLKKFFKKIKINNSKKKKKIKKKFKIAYSANEEYVRKVDGKIEVDINHLKTT